jgi:hypothetical protein
MLISEYCKICDRNHGPGGLTCEWCHKTIGCNARKILIVESKTKYFETELYHNVFHLKCYNKLISKSKRFKDFEITHPGPWPWLESGEL